MNRYCAIVLVLTAFLSSEDCGATMANFLGSVPQTNLKQSPDKGIRASGDSAKATDNIGQSVDDEIAAKKIDNVQRGSKMSFDKINNAIDLNPYDSHGYATKAAMQIAAGQDPGQTLGEGRSAVRKSFLSTEEDLQYNYEAELQRLSGQLPPGEPRDKVNAVLCPKVREYRKTHPPSDPIYSDTTC